MCRSIRSCGTKVDYHITPGYTSQLQILEVEVDKPFKGYVQAAWENFMIQNIENKKVMRDNVAQWVEAPWAKVTVSLITKT